MKKKKTLPDLWSPIPNKFILNGTYNELTANDWCVYHILSMHQNYNTHVSDVRYSLIRKYKKMSGKAIHLALKHLQDLNMISPTTTFYNSKYGIKHKNAYHLLGF